jgi:hypothetical protein
VSAEVPKLHHRLSLGDPAITGDRPAEVIVLLADPAAFLAPPRPAASVPRDPAPDERAMAFPGRGRFDYV